MPYTSEGGEKEQMFKLLIYMIGQSTKTEEINL